MPKTIKEVYQDYTGYTTIEYSDDTTRKYSAADVATVVTDSSGKAVGVAGDDGMPIGIAVSQTSPSSVTGTLVMTPLAVLQIPASLCVAGKSAKIRAIYSSVGANNKTFQMQLAELGAGVSGATYFYNAGNVQMSGTLVCEATVVFRSPTSQLGAQTNTFSGFGVSSDQPIQMNKNGAGGLEILVSAQLSNIADYITLESATLEVK